MSINSTVPSGRKPFSVYCRRILSDIIAFMSTNADKLWWSPQHSAIKLARGAFGSPLKPKHGLLPWYERDGYESRIHGLSDRRRLTLLFALGESDHPYHQEALAALRLGVLELIGAY